MPSLSGLPFPLRLFRRALLSLLFRSPALPFCPLLRAKWLAPRDSNPDKAVQSRLCYRYTRGQPHRTLLLYARGGGVQDRTARFRQSGQRSVTVEVVGGMLTLFQDFASTRWVACPRRTAWPCHPPMLFLPKRIQDNHEGQLFIGQVLIAMAQNPGSGWACAFRSLHAHATAQREHATRAMRGAGEPAGKSWHTPPARLGILSPLPGT